MTIAMKIFKTMLTSMALATAAVILTACRVDMGRGTRVYGKGAMHHGEQIVSEQPLSASIDKISASSYLKIVVRYADTPRLKITAPNTKRRLTIREEAGGRLVVFENKREFKTKEGAFLVEVFTPTPLSAIKTSGVVVASAAGVRWQPKVSLETSGSSRLAIDKVSATETTLVDCSGASKLNVGQIHTSELKAETSGASRAEIRIFETNSLTLDTSGASSITLAGKAKQAKVSASGASKVYASEVVAHRADLSTSGAAKITDISVSDEILLESSGASKIYYRGEPRVKSLSTSGASTIKKIQ